MDESNEVRLHFCIDSKGGGTTEIYLDFGPKDFAAIVAAMAEVDRQIAMLAMSTEFAKQVEQQPLLDAGLISDGRQSVRTAARREMFAAPRNNNDAERFTYQRVSRIIQELIESENERNDSSGDAAAA